ncbi:phage virion morphogenesis protein [Pseudomonas sp. P3C3]
MAVSIQLDSNLAAVQRVFTSIRQMGANPQPLLQQIALYGENSTRERFSTQTGPDGQRWKPSLRALHSGGKTLTKDGHLGDSITSQADSEAAEWGTNRIYAAVHQFGATIAAKAGQFLRFAIPGLGWASKRQVKIEARAFLGVSAEDSREILDLAADHITQLIRRSAAGGA